MIACLGLSFKPNIDDLRESPAMKISKDVELMGFKINYICEPNIKLIPEIFDSTKTQLVDFSKALSESDILVLLVDHEEFKKIEFSFLINKEVIDSRGIWTR